MPRGSTSPAASVTSAPPASGILITAPSGWGPTAPTVGRPSSAVVQYALVASTASPRTSCWRDASVTTTLAGGEADGSADDCEEGQVTRIATTAATAARGA